MPEKEINKKKDNFVFHDVEKMVRLLFNTILA
jgi:hypothetical protein